MALVTLARYEYPDVEMFGFVAMAPPAKASFPANL
jgi:hypothetical protein